MVQYDTADRVCCAPHLVSPRFTPSRQSMGFFYRPRSLWKRRTSPNKHILIESPVDLVELGIHARAPFQSPSCPRNRHNAQNFVLLYTSTRLLEVAVLINHTLRFSRLALSSEMTFANCQFPDKQPLYKTGKDLDVSHRISFPPTGSVWVPPLFHAGSVSALFSDVLEAQKK